MAPSGWEKPVGGEEEKGGDRESKWTRTRDLYIMKGAKLHNSESNPLGGGVYNGKTV